MTNLAFQINKAHPENLNSIKLLMKKFKLVFEDIENHLENFLVIQDENEIIGCAGIEHYKDVGLLRSLAIDVKFQDKGLGKKLVNKMIEYAQKKGIVNLYLLTNTAEDYFKKLGFKAVPRSNVDPRIKQTYEYSTGCEETATVMVKNIKSTHSSTPYKKV